VVNLSKHTKLTITNMTDQNVTLYIYYNCTWDFAWFPMPLNTAEISSYKSINPDIAFIPNSV